MGGGINGSIASWVVALPMIENVVSEVMTIPIIYTLYTTCIQPLPLLRLNGHVGAIPT